MKDLFLKIIMMCFDDDDFVREYNRLCGESIKNKSKSGIEIMVNKACGLDEFGNSQIELEKFADFCLFSFGIKNRYSDIVKKLDNI